MTVQEEVALYLPCISPVSPLYLPCISPSQVRHGMTVQEEVAGLRDEFANTDKDDAGTMTTVMAVAMAGRAIRPSLDVRCSGDMGRCGRDMGRHGGNIREI